MTMSHTFDPSGAKKHTPSSPTGAGAKRSPLASFVLLGACACLVLTPIWFDWRSRFTLGNTLLSVLGVVLYALLPALILWRIRDDKPLANNLKLVTVGAIGVLFVLILVTWLATGYARFAGWADWLELLARFAVAGVLIWFAHLSTRTIPPLAVLAVFGLVMVASMAFRAWDVSTLTAADWKAHPFLNGRSTVAVLEKILVTMVVFGFAASRFGHDDTGNGAK